ncbi:thiamine pyrophosphate-dependent dehydrogenase E1 component subunit alpha [Micromonospora sp. ALFpr18c]|uniref:thiamine pyrophosphate-dependent dehydrogenase E1 component subunit alpha n=1 Tax=unclassified Micromonospora TaxID=2617518 RepID=UPI00124BADED|nr:MULTISPECIES: thiamine pyrophosphate-dependent dehydrogenase E1 component subunit alpha [unclassified Micromonospora]KAB1937234.1 thiamine pyrophosphate-dependent dehydrogenase E1 component subunit alpha [Micromonospora sp. ALFpr18c]MDG4757875.1 thiamine pyrophosphate-dependent dehydrogenase E1 component subunit alpha [Micromonospora sp. WMMD710]
MTDADPVRLYRTVRLIRRFEERAVELVHGGQIVGGIHPYLGQEGIAAGVCAALGADDVVAGTHRGHGHVLARGADPARMLAELCGRVTGLNAGRGGSMHAADFSLGVLGANAIVGASGAIITGAVWGRRRQGRDTVGVSFFGDGAVNEGMLLEAFNLAALWRVPVLFVCENNGYATTMPIAGAVAGSIAGRAAAFGIPAARVDGQDPETVRAAAAAAVDRMRAGGGPELIEARTYRFDAHHTFEHAVRLDYRPPDEVTRGRARDPVRIQGERLPDADRAAVDAEVEATLDAAVRFALDSPRPDPADALAYLYASGLTGRTGGG